MLTGNIQKTQTQDETRNWRHEIKEILIHAPKINQFIEGGRCDGQSEYKYEYEDDETLN